MVQRLAGAALALMVALIIGFGAGVHWAHASRSRELAKAADAAITTVTAKVVAQNAAVTKQLAQQADATATLNAQQSVVRGSSAAIQMEIQHVVFLPAPAATCSDPVRSDAFVRLYDVAAEGGGGAPAAASTAAR